MLDSATAPMNCHLLVPDLFWPSASGGEPARDLDLPALETLLARGNRTRTPGASLERWLAAEWGLPGSLPLAPYSLSGDGGEPGSDWWMRADPVHLKVHGNRLVLADASRLRLSAEEAGEFVGALNKQFAPDGVEFVAPRPERWYARLKDEPRIQAAPTSEMAGRSIDGFLPQGEDAARWRRIANEAQMLLHAHPRNEAREAHGLLAVNSLWFWGAGRFKPLSSPWDAVWADHPLAAGLARAASDITRPLASTAAAVIAKSGAASVLVVDPLPATAYGEISIWHEAVVTMEHVWCEPLLAAVGGAIRTLTLHGLGPDYGYTAACSGGDRWRFWRARRPLHTYALSAAEVNRDS